MKIDIFSRAILLGTIATIVTSCAAPDTRHHIVISTREQKLALLDRGNLMAIYPVSTSKFGLGDWPGSSCTPLGELEVAQKIGDHAPSGTVLKDDAARARSLHQIRPGVIQSLRVFFGCVAAILKTHRHMRA
jgi:L,D-transpeptidase-like protein